MNKTILRNHNNKWSLSISDYGSFDTCVIVIDHQGRITSFDPGVVNIFGYIADDVLGKNADILIAETSREECNHHLLNYLRTENASAFPNPLQILGQCKGGLAFPMSMFLKKLSINGQCVPVLVLRDIRKENILTQDLRKLASAIELNPCATMITDTQGVIEYVNPCFVKTSGYSYEEIIGNKPNMLKSGIHPPKFYTTLWDTLLAGHTWQGEFCNKTKDENLIWESVVIAPLRDPNGEISHFITVKLDETKIKHSEKKLVAYARELKRSNEALKDFAAIASHDLQEPLRKIRTFAELLNTTLKSLDDRSRDYLVRMQKSARKMQSFIDDLLEYSKAANKPRQLEQIDLKEVIDDILDDLESRIHQTKCKFDIKTLPKIEADRMQMRQLFANLISNSIKYRNTENTAEIVLDSRISDAGFWEITVEDNGIGFDIKYLDRIFKPFQRLHGHSQIEGNGMGLSICKKIVEIHGGEITAMSQPLMGSRFIINLPEKQSAR